MPFATRLALLFAVSLPALLMQMRAYSGPVWSAHLRSTSHVTENGTTVALRNEASGLRFISYNCDGTLCDGTYFDGERLYSININGTTLPQPNGADPLLRAERTVASLAFLAPDFTSQGGRIDDEGLTKIGGVAYRTLLVSNGDAVPIRVYVDPADASVKYMRDIDGDMTIEYRDYTEVAGGFHLPLRVLRNGALLEKYDARGVLPTPFAAPSGLAATFTSRPAVVGTDPQRATPIFPCTLAGIATTCLLDSGNSGLAISGALAAALHAQSVGSFQVSGLGDYATQVVRAGPLAIDTMTLPEANYVVLPDIDRFGYSVVLGADCLAATTVQLDNATHRLLFGVDPPSGGYAVPLAFVDFVPVIDVRLGTVPAQLALDTGDESSINLAYDFYEAHRGLFSLTGERAISGVGGSSVELLGTIPNVQVGALAIPASAIGTTRNLQGTAYGHFGAGMLERFNVTIDYAAGQVQLSPLANH
jgi:hypothetical protein